MNPLAEHLRFYQELGVTGINRDRKWRSREGVPRVPEVPSVAGAGVSGVSEISEAAAIPVTIARSAAEALAAIRDDIGECTRCKLHTLGRTQIVFGVGNPEADLMFVGEAPGADEDVQGIPFVGRAGQLLTKMIEAMGFRRDEVYIANVLKCRPPENRTPVPSEVEKCIPYLEQQIALVRPDLIVALGLSAAQGLLGTKASMGALRGRTFEYKGVPLVATYHPAALLRNPGLKKDAWVDLQRVRDMLHDGAPA